MKPELHIHACSSEIPVPTPNSQEQSNICSNILKHELNPKLPGFVRYSQFLNEGFKILIVMFYNHKSKFEYQEVGASSFDIYFLLMGPMFSKVEVRQAYIFVGQDTHTHM